MALDLIAETFGLSNGELGSLFGVTDEGARLWRKTGRIAKRHWGRIAAIRELAESWCKWFIPETRAAQFRKPIPALGNLSALELIQRHREDLVAKSSTQALGDGQCGPSGSLP